jgi:hypothetical protein
MSQDLTKYFQAVQERDFLRDHQFRVSSLLYRGIPLLSEDDLVYIKAGSLPTRSVNAVPVPFMGLNYKVPGTAQFGDNYTVTFYADSSGLIRNIFEAFSMATFDDRTSNGNYNVQGADVLQFYTYDQRGVEAITSAYQLVGIFPTDIGSLNMSPVGNGNALEFTVNLAYQYWRKIVHAPVKQGTIRTVPPGGGSFPIGGV